MSIRIIHGDCRDVLLTLPSDSVDCIVTSPPYWGLRDYGVVGQIGLEPTLADYLEIMAGVCRELRRVLKPTGTFWLNVGDSYAGAPGGFQGKNGQRSMRTFTARIDMPKRGGGMKPKDLCMVPNRLAIALQDDGWYVRSEIIWSKPNPMPESITDRPTSAHEKIFLLTKSARYFYDADAVREPMAAASIARLAQDVEAQAGSMRANGGAKTNGPMKAVAKGNAKSFRGGGAYTKGQSFNNDGLFERETHGNQPNTAGNRNLRNVWTIATRPFKEAHFATFPPELAERCIKAGCPQGGSVLDPFGGAGTTGLVADRLGRNATLIELNPDYREMAAQRIENDAPLFSEVAS